MELDALFPYVMPQVKSCPDPTALHHIRQALITFCTKTLVWRPNLEIVTTAGIDEYDIPLPAGSSLVKLLCAGLDDCEGLDIVDPGTGTSTTSRTTKGRVWTEDRKSVFLSPAPSIDGRVLKLQIALKPTQSTDEIDDGLFEDFAPIVADGALATLFDMADVTWANPGKALTKRTDFKAACGRTAARVAKGFGRSRRSTRPFTY